MKTLINGFEVKATREATGLRHSELITFLDSKGFSGWTVQRLVALEKSGTVLNEAASREFFRAFEEATAAGDGAGNLALPEPADPRSWEAVRQTPVFAVALDIARQERNSQIQLDQARATLEASDFDFDAGESFSTALRFHRNDNNVLWGAARMLAALVDDDELGALSVLRAELDRQDAGKAEDPYDRWMRAQTR